MFRRLPTSLATSISNPTISPFSFWNSHGTLPTFAPTFMSAAEAIVPADIANTAVKVAANVPRRVNFTDIWSSILHAGSIAGDRFSAAVWWPAPWKTCKGR